MIADISAEFTQWFQNPVELVAALAGFFCVWLAVKENIWNWPVAIVSTALYVYVFYEAKFYLDTGLQVFFIVSQFYGWVVWSQRNHRVKATTTLTVNNRLLCSLIFIFTALGMYFAVTQFKKDASLPLVDAITTTLSVIAAVLQARKILENWLLWILADIIYIPMYLHKSLTLTAILYAVFLVLAVLGYVEWRKHMLPGVQNRGQSLSHS